MLLPTDLAFAYDHFWIEQGHEHFDVVIQLDPKQWVTPALKERRLRRIWREGITAKGDRRIP